MFLRCFVRTNYCRRLLLPDHSCLSTTNIVQQKHNFCSSFHNGLFTKAEKEKKSQQNITYSVLLHRKHYCKGVTNNDSRYDTEITKIKELFSQPRVTLNELASKTPEKVFDVHYKQMVITPKGGKKKAVMNNDWYCAYSFVWPEKMKFESTAISKRQAAEKAATQAVHWLYTNKRIDSHGNPIYNKDVLNEIRSTINKPIYASISQNSIERIERIWGDYETDIKNIYEATFKAAKQKMLPSQVVLNKDSTIDEEDYPEDSTQINEADDTLELKTHIHPVFGRMFNQPTEATLERRDRVLKNKFQDYGEGLVPLPIDLYAEQIVSTLENSRVAVIVGAAGCGKSTRVPAAILRHCGAATTAIVSEPRRVAAIGLAQRVADELGEQVGESIGYQVRLHAKPPRPPGGAVLYCTSGVLLKRLQLNPGLEGCSHVFIDEAHERDVNTDITLLLLKRALDLNPTLKVVVMSATLDTEVFTRYFDPCPVIEVPGRTFPVKVLNLEEVQTSLNIKLPFTMENCQKEDQKPQVNCQEVAEVIKAVDRKQKEGAILVFLPGWGEIKQTKQILDEHYGTSGLHLILPVHSRLSTTDQTKMFAKPLPGVRKVVLATNIAETSITIPDVVYVVDAGAHKENRIKEGTGTASLEKVWVSLAGAKQRTGRAGRVQPGICYRLYTQEKEAEFAQHTTPEILRIPLEQTVLDCKTYAPDDKVEAFLSQLPEPPTKKAIDFAVKDLIEIGALSKAEQLTRLGAILSSLSLHPRLARGVLHAAVVGSVVAAANVATHCSDSVELFRNAADRRDEIRDIKRKFSPVSDHAAFHWIQDEFEQTLEQRGWQGIDQWCDKYGLRKDRLGYVKALSNLHLEQLFKSGFIEADPDVQELNRFSELDEFTSAVLLSGSDSLLVTRKYVKTKGKLATVTELFTSTGDRAHIGSESVNYNIKKHTNTTHLLTYFGGHHSAERRALLVHRTSLVSPHAVLLFCGGRIGREELPDSDGETTELCLRKHKLKIQMPSRQADLIIKAREMLWNTFQYYIDRDLHNLNEDHATASRFKVRLIKAIGRILVEGEREYLQVKRSEEEIR